MNKKKNPWPLMSQFTVLNIRGILSQLNVSNNTVFPPSLNQMILIFLITFNMWVFDTLVYPDSPTKGKWTVMGPCHSSAGVRLRAFKNPLPKRCTPSAPLSGRNKEAKPNAGAPNP